VQGLRPDAVVEAEAARDLLPVGADLLGAISLMKVILVAMRSDA
jgi:hypothetical protein